MARRKQVKRRQGEEEGDSEAKEDRAGVLKIRCGVGPDLWATTPGVLLSSLLSVWVARGFRTWSTGYRYGEKVLFFLNLILFI